MLFIFSVATVPFSGLLETLVHLSIHNKPFIVLFRSFFIKFLNCVVANFTVERSRIKKEKREGYKDLKSIIKSL